MIDSKLRGCDLVKIKIGDIVSGADIRTRAIVIRQGTGKPVQCELTAGVGASLLAWRYLGVDIEDALILAERTDI